MIVLAEERLCSSCSKAFISKWRYTRCLACRYRESYKDQCGCGNSKDGRAAKCRRCSLGQLTALAPLTAPDSAWVAGLLEAEGTFPRRKTGGGTIRVQMSDQDVVDRLHAVLRIGNRGTYTPQNPRHKQSWMLTVARREYVEWLLQQVTPLMSARRRAAIECLASNFSKPLAIPAAPAADFAAIPDPTATAWLAGLIEGDGCIRRNEVAVATVDRDVAERARLLAGCGHVYY